MRLALVAALALAVAGCSSGFQAYDQGAEEAKDTLAGIADRKLEKDMYGLCEANSVGAIRRKFGNDPAGMKHYNGLCATRSAGNIYLQPANEETASQ